MKLRPVDPFDAERDRFGSAYFADKAIAQACGVLTKQTGDLFAGFIGKTPIWYGGNGGTIVCAGARAGKLRDWLGYNICAGICSDTLVILDPKNECARISQNQVLGNKFCLYWPKDSVNPVSYIRKDSLTLVSDVKVLCGNVIVLSGGANALFFERRGRQYLEALILVIVEIDGVLTLPRLYWAINLLIAGGSAWLDFAYHMHVSQFEIARTIEEEIAEARVSPEGGGYRGILGELSNPFACLSDPDLMRSVSPPFKFELEDLTSSEQAYNFYITPPAAFLGAWSPVIKAMLVGLKLLKARAPCAPRQTWLIDEPAQLKRFPLIIDLYSIAAGEGCRPVTLWQSTFQMRALGPDAENIITSSAELRCYFGIRDLSSAQTLSRMLGSQTLEYDDVLQQARAEHARKHALEALTGGEDLISAALKYDHYRRAARIKSKQHRDLRTPAEILQTPRDKMYLFMDALPAPVYADRAPYWEQPWMAGRFHPNPYHAPLDQVQVRTPQGDQWCRIIEEDVPPEYAHFPQYAEGGRWSYVEGLRP